MTFGPFDVQYHVQPPEVASGGDQKAHTREVVARARGER